MRLSDEEYIRRFFAAATIVQKVQLAIREGRYTIWARDNPPNFPDEYLLPILELPSNHPVFTKTRLSGGDGLSYVFELKYGYSEMGRKIRVYLKGFFRNGPKGKLILELCIQSLKKDSDQI